MATARQFIRAALEEDGGIRVVGEAANGEEAVALAARLRPDVIIMDVLMPVLDGVGATRRIMAVCPTPVVVVTSLPLTDGSVLSRMMEAGAVDVIGKAFGRDPHASARMRAQLVATVKEAARSRMKPLRPELLLGTAAGAASGPARPRVRPTQPIRALVLGASTGGPTALQTIFRALPADFPCPILVVQHIARGFTSWLAGWLAATTPLPVSLARDGEAALPGHIYLAPDDQHLLLTATRTLRLNRALPVHSVRPAVDPLFVSAGQALGAGVLAVVLTGMGSDGAEGARQIRAAGGIVLAQDADSCAIFGMPRAVIAAGAADEVLPLAEMAGRIRALCAEALP